MQFLKPLYEKGEIFVRGKQIATHDVALYNDNLLIIAENVMMLSREDEIKMRKTHNIPVLRFLMDRWFYTHIFYMEEELHKIVRFLLFFCRFRNYGGVTYKKLGKNRYYICKVKKFNPEKEKPVLRKSWKLAE